MKNKTLAAWLALMGGPLGLHRFYLRGLTDAAGWLLIIPTTLGMYGVHRAKNFGQDDHLSWILIPFLGITIAATALNAIILGLTSEEKWNSNYNQPMPAETLSGRTNWLTAAALVASLFIGSTALMASLAFSFQRYFEYQIEQSPPTTEPLVKTSAD